MSNIKKKKENAKPFLENVYQNLSLTDLVLFGLFSLETKSIEADFPNLVAECFELFPNKFSLQGYPKYPDSWRVGREIQRMSGTLPSHGIEKLVIGNIKSNFRLTEKGLNKIKDLQRILELKGEAVVIISKRLSDTRQKIGRVIREIERHPLYNRYLERKSNMDVPVSLLRDLLFATMETSHEQLREKMKTLIEYCDSHGSSEHIKEFLEFCSNKHGQIFASSLKSNRE